MATPAAETTSDSHPAGMSIGRLGMWLFIATEVMFFTALLASYIVLRMGSDAWPSAATMHVDRIIGLANTLVLLASGAAVAQAARSLGASKPLVARVWLLLAVMLGTLFIGVKSYEYREKYRHNLFPAPGGGPIFNQADAAYLSAVRQRVQTLQAELRESPDAPEAAERLAWLDQFATGDLLEAERGLRDPRPTSGAIARCDALALSIFPRSDAESAGYNEQLPWLRLPIVVPGGRLWVSTYFLLTGAHLAHLLAALVVASWWVLVGLTRRTLSAVKNLSLYWHLVDAVWIVLFVVIYLS